MTNCRAAGDLEVDWVAAYNDMHWLLEIERSARVLGLPPRLTQLLVDLHGRRDEQPVRTN